jgi:hypothetical protein
MASPGKSLREQIMNAYEDQLQLIVAGATYNSNLGANINEWKETPFAETVTLGLIYKDTQDSIAQTFGNQEHDLTVDNEILIVGTATTMRQVIADVTKCLGANLTLGGLCEDMIPISTESVECEHANRKAFWVTIKIIIQFVTANWNPYA